MKEKLRALGLVVVLTALTYPIDWYAAETRVFLLHVVAVMLIDILVSTVRFTRPSDEG
jgi:hypothetical protein